MLWWLVVQVGPTLGIRISITDCTRVTKGTTLPYRVEGHLSARRPYPYPKHLLALSLHAQTFLQEDLGKLRSRRETCLLGNPEQPCVQSVELWSLSPVPKWEHKVTGSVQPLSWAKKTVP